MLDIKALIESLKGKGNVTINVINISDKDAAPVVEEVVEDTLESDFEVGDRVWVCHTAKDGSGTRHTEGTVDSIDTDDFGPYVRVTGDNGKHYKCGLTMNEERKGSKIFGYSH